MLQIILGVIVASILLLISFIHFYWALGPMTHFSPKVIPSINGQPALRPTKLITALVAFVLFIMAVVVLLLSFEFFSHFAPWLSLLIGTALALGFIFRALGDFRLVGFLKKIKKTEFAFYDTFFWSPLCLLLGFSILYVTWI